MKAIVKNDGEKQDTGVKEDNEEKEEKTQETTENKQFDENVPVKQAREEKVDQRAKPGVLVRQDTVIKEPLDAAMAEVMDGAPNSLWARCALPIDDTQGEGHDVWGKKRQQ